MASVYSRALAKCRVKLIDAVREDVQFVSDSLCQDNIVSQRELEELQGTKRQKARLIINAVEIEVRCDHQFFDKFVKILQRNYHFNDIVTMLQECIEKGN